MRILYVVHQFFPMYYTGTEKFVFNVAKQMQRMGHHVEVLTYGFGDEENFSYVDGAMIKKYFYMGIPVTSIRHREIPDDIGFSILSNGLDNLLRSIVSQGGFDLIHIAHPMRLGNIMKIAKNAGIPVVLTLTDFWVMCPRAIAVTTKGELCLNPECGEKCANECYGSKWHSLSLARFEDVKGLIESADEIVAPTYFLGGVIKSIFSREIRVIRHGIDYTHVITNNRRKRAGDEVVFGYIGTVIPHKGVHVILDAVKKSRARNIRVNIHGSCFRETDYYERLVDSAKNDVRITFFGPYKEEELPSIINNVDFILAPSLWWENSPLTVLTSLSYLAPVITISIGGAAELVKDGINGYTFSIGNSDELSKILDLISADPEVVNRLKDNIVRPPRCEEEAYYYEKIYQSLR